MPPAYEVLLLNTAIPQIQAAQSGDTYVVPRDIAFSTVANLANGTNLLPSLTFSSDTNTGIYREGADALGFTAGGGTNQMVLTSTGLGVGTNNPATKLEVQNSTTIVARLRNTNKGTNTVAQLQLVTSNDFDGNSLAAIGAISENINTRATALGLYSEGSDGVLGERARIDSSGNLGLGVTPSAWSGVNALQVGSGAALYDFGSANVVLGSNVYFNGTDNKYISADYATYYQQNNGVHIWATAASGTAGATISFTQAMTLDSLGNLVVGGTSANVGTWNKAITLNTASGNASYELTVAGAAKGFFAADASNVYLQSSGAIPIIFTTNGGERARITSGGYFKASNDGTYVNSTGNFHELRTSANDTQTTTFSHTAASPYGIIIRYTAASPNNTDNWFWYCDDGGATQRASLKSNGGLYNYQANDSNLSDRREKTNFAPAKSYLDTICAIPVQTFNYIDQSEDDPGLTLGVVAQDVQAVAPELVTESNWGTKDDPKMRLSIYQTDLQYALMKCIQELKSELDSVKAELVTLKGA